MASGEVVGVKAEEMLKDSIDSAKENLNATVAVIKGSTSEILYIND